MRQEASSSGTAETPNPIIRVRSALTHYDNDTTGLHRSREIQGQAFILYSPLPNLSSERRRFTWPLRESQFPF